MTKVAYYNLPDVGEGLTEAEIVSWKVAVGDTVIVDRIDAKAGAAVSFPALLVVEGATVTSDAKALAGVKVTGEIVAPSHIENARNYAAGSLNLKDSSEFSTRALSFFAYGAQPSSTTTYRQELNILKQYGFNVISEPDLDKIYPCDGVVFRVNDTQLFQDMGYTAKHPRGAYAKKERQAHVETKLLAVEWQVGKSGKVTPVAILEPVYIGDALVSRATLNNPGFIEMLDLQIGDTVAIIRSGEIIPCILHKVDA